MPGSRAGSGEQERLRPCSRSHSPARPGTTSPPRGTPRRNRQQMVDREERVPALARSCRSALHRVVVRHQCGDLGIADPLQQGLPWRRGSCTGCGSSPGSGSRFHLRISVAKPVWSNSNVAGLDHDTVGRHVSSSVFRSTPRHSDPRWWARSKRTPLPAPPGRPCAPGEVVGEAPVARPSPAASGFGPTRSTPAR